MNTSVFSYRYVNTNVYTCVLVYAYACGYADGYYHASAYVASETCLVSESADTVTNESQNTVTSLCCTEV